MCESLMCCLHLHYYLLHPLINISRFFFFCMVSCTWQLHGIAGIAREILKGPWPHVIWKSLCECEIVTISCFWCERLEERHALVFFLTTHGVGWGGAVFTFLQLAHAGDAHAMNATLLMGWCGVGLCSGSFNLHTLVMHTPWMLRYSWGGVGGAVFTFLQLAQAGDAHAMKATLLMGWCGVRLCSRSFNLHTLVMHTPWMLRYSWGGVGWGCVHVPSTCTRWWCTRHECYATHGCGVGLCSRSFNLHTLVMHTPWMLRYSWGGVGWGCVHVPSTCTRWWCTRHECYATHGVVWGEAVVRFLQLAHAGDAHAMNATLLMGWCGWGCVHVPSTCTRWWCTRHECYATHGVVWGGAVFMFLQLAHAGDAHAMNATVLMGWCGVAVFMFLQLAHAGHGVGVGVGVGGVMLLTFNWSRTPTWCYAQLLHLHKRCHVGVERFWGMPLGGFGRLLTVNMIGCNRPRSAGLLWRFHAWLHWLGCQLVWRKYRVHIYIYIYFL